LLPVLLLGGVVWFYRFSGPNTEITRHGEELLVTNLIFGEKDLGYSEVMLVEADTTKPVFHARCGAAPLWGPLRFRGGDNPTTLGNEWPWEVLVPLGVTSFHLAPGRVYRLKVATVLRWELSVRPLRPEHRQTRLLPH